MCNTQHLSDMVVCNYYKHAMLFFKFWMCNYKMDDSLGGYKLKKLLKKNLKPKTQK
jgi:hypothetical protein